MKFKNLKIYSRLLMSFSTFDFPACHHPSAPIGEQCAVAGRRLSTHCRGLAALPTILLLGIVSLVIALEITTLSFTELFISQGGSQSSRALFYAEAGARDALIKVARNKTYLCALADCYSIDFSTNGCSLLNDCAKVQVTGNDTAKVVTSKGIMKASTRILQVTVTLDTDGAITGTTWSEAMN